MPRTRIKICGIRDVAAARAAARAGADAVGLVFVPGTPRYIGEDALARRIIDSLPALVEPVGLFVDEPIEAVHRRAAELNLRTVQLHGREGPEYVAALAPLRVIKALAFRGGDPAGQLAPWRRPCANLAGLIMDAPPPQTPAATASGRAGADATAEAPPSPARSGGHGRAFDWDELAAWLRAGVLEGLAPLILAGGLTPANVGRAVRLLRPYGVDVSSSVEAPGHRKDAALIAAFCHAVRQADAEDEGEDKDEDEAGSSGHRGHAAQHDAFTDAVDAESDTP